MSGISFLTPIRYENQPTTFGQKALEVVDSYFYFGGRIAVVVPSAMKNGSAEVQMRDGKLTWLQVASKISYATVILPVLLMVAKAFLRSFYRFHECQNKGTPQPPHQRPDILDYPIAKAPLTLVRSDKPVDLKISILFNQQFAPQYPIEPKPTSITKKADRETYSWNVRTQQDGSLVLSSLEGLQTKIKMIWWEAIRKEQKAQIDHAQAICVASSEVKNVLGAILQKSGLSDQESHAFKQYWHEIFTNNYDPQHTPFVMVQLVEKENNGKYLPQMTIDGEEAESFDLQRFYFLFEPVSQPAHGVDQESYLKQLATKTLGSRVVIDLGGELAHSPEMQIKQNWPGEDAFNKKFIETYIYGTN